MKYEYSISYIGSYSRINDSMDWITLLLLGAGSMRETI